MILGGPNGSCKGPKGILQTARFLETPLSWALIAGPCVHTICHTMLYQTILYHTVVYHTVSYHTILQGSLFFNGLWGLDGMAFCLQLWSQKPFLGTAVYYLGLVLAGGTVWQYWGSCWVLCIYIYIYIDIVTSIPIYTYISVYFRRRAGSHEHWDRDQSTRFAGSGRETMKVCSLRWWASPLLAAITIRKSGYFCTTGTSRQSNLLTKKQKHLDPSGPNKESGLLLRNLI